MADSNKRLIRMACSSLWLSTKRFIESDLNKTPGNIEFIFFPFPGMVQTEWHFPGSILSAILGSKMRFCRNKVDESVVSCAGSCNIAPYLD